MVTMFYIQNVQQYEFEGLTDASLSCIALRNLSDGVFLLLYGENWIVTLSSAPFPVRVLTSGTWKGVMGRAVV